MQLKILYQFAENSATDKISLLKRIRQEAPNSTKFISQYHAALLFSLAYPENQEVEKLACLEMERLTKQVKDSVKFASYEGSGLPYTATVGTFSLTICKWLIDSKLVKVRIHSFLPSAPHPRDVLAPCLNPMEFELLGNEELKAIAWLKFVFGTKNPEVLMERIINAVWNLPLNLAYREKIFESLSVFVFIKPLTLNFSNTFGRLSFEKTNYVTSGLLKKVDHLQLIKQPIKKEARLSDSQRKEILDVSRTALVLLNRETDPITYCDAQGIKYFQLERGCSIALFSMLPAYQLPLESYIGFMMFKNGYPMAYGGGWLFGQRSLIGINIFESFRGGESAFVFAQLLRTYYQVFGVREFEVEPYQYGKKNPEGIRSGAFWFYYRFGFRPIKASLAELANNEYEKIRNNKSYRSDTETLKKFATGNLSVNFGIETTTLTAKNLSEYITQKIISDFNGDRIAAKKWAYQEVKNLFGLTPPDFKGAEGIQWDRFALLLALCINKKKMSISAKAEIKNMIVKKVYSEYDYIKLLRRLIGKKYFKI